MKLVLFVFVFFTQFASGQTPELALAKWAASNRIEKIHIQTDRDEYLAGETAWFKAYLAADQMPDIISSSLYTEVYRPDGKMVERKIFPVVAGTARGHLDLPDSLLQGNYLLVAYTAGMALSSPEFLFRKKIFIHGKKAAGSPTHAEAVLMQFFPEAGNLIAGKNNSIAFQVTNADGQPLDKKGTIIDDKGSIITSFETYHDGRGYFELNPLPGMRYQAMIDSAHFDLPKAAEKGIVLSIVPHPQGYFFEIDQNHSEAALRADYLVGQMQHQPVFRIQLANGQEDLQGVINTGSLHSGIMQVTAFNKDGFPLAERLCFVNNHEYELKGEIVFDTLNTGPRARNHFLLNLKDTVQGSFSLSVTDAEFGNGKMREQNIYSSLLLSDDLPGRVNDPAWYFRGDADSTATAMDLLMMTNGWRRFSWTSILRDSIKKTLPAKGFISLEGKALIRGTRRPFADHPLMVMVYDSKKNRITQLTKTDSKGNFQVDSLVFYGKNRLIFSDIKGKKSEYLDIVLTADSLNRSYALPKLAPSWFLDPAPGPLTAFAADLDEIQKASGLMLENVTVKAIKKTPLQELDDKYTNGAFSGPTDKAIDLVNNNEAEVYPNIFEYLKARVNGLVVNQDGGDYSLQYRQSASISSMGAFPMVLFLDEVETDASFISAIPANQIALIKLFPNFVAANGNAPGGALAIYTKKGTDFVSSRGPINFGYYNGYSISKEFYAPNYKDKSESKPDHRITLDWRPDIFCNYVNPVLPFTFYNNDRTKSFRVVVEGMTIDGKLLYLEKLIGK